MNVPEILKGRERIGRENGNAIMLEKILDGISCGIMNGIEEEIDIGMRVLDMRNFEKEVEIEIGTGIEKEVQGRSAVLGRKEVLTGIENGGPARTENTANIEKVTIDEDILFFLQSTIKFHSPV